MAKVQPKKRGRPATGKDDRHIGARLPEKFAASVDAWAAKTDGGISRSEAMRRLVEIGLKTKGKAR